MSSWSSEVPRLGWSLSHRFACLLALLCCTEGAWAHDSWLRLSTDQPGDGLAVLLLQVGDRYPRSEDATPPGRIANAGCVADNATRVPLQPRGERGASLELRTRLPGAAAASCWVELKPKSIDMTDPLVQVYFDEIRAPAATRMAWQKMQAQGVRWAEVFRKFARIEWTNPGSREPVDRTTLRRPAGAPLELLAVGSASFRRGVESEFIALADGMPLAGQPVEVVSSTTPFGIWRETDAQGRFRVALPLSGEWLLRSTRLDIPQDSLQPWQSRFATLTIHVP